MAKNLEDGGGVEPFTPVADSFAGGITAPTPRIYHQDAERPQPRYSDDWAKVAFNPNSIPAGTFDKNRLK
jgi:hypothetical protein